MKFAQNRVFSLLVILIPILAWIYVILNYSVNVPWFDDFDPFLDFIDKWTSTSNVSQKLFLLFQPNNEHRMVFGKLLNLIYFQLTGQVNFTAIHCMAAAFTLGTCLILWNVFRKLDLQPIYFLPVSLLLFQVQYHLIFLWAICGMQHETVVFFVCLTCYLLATNRFGWALAAGLCSNFAMSNGIFVWVSGLSILLICSDWKRIAIWSTSAIVAITLYFKGMSPQGNEDSFAFFIKNPEQSLFGFLGHLGGIFDFTPDKPIELRLILPVFLGLLAVIWATLWLSGLLSRAFFPRLKINRLFSKWVPLPQDTTVTYFCLGVLTFLLSNAAVIGLLRPRFGLFVVVVSNYKLYPALFFIIVFLTLLATFKDSVRLKTVVTLGTGAALVVYGLSLLHYLPSLVERRKYLLVNAYNQENHVFGLGFEPGSAASDYIDRLMKRLIDRGDYSYPHPDVSFFKNRIDKITGPVPKELTLQINQNEEGIRISEPNHRYRFGKNDGLYVFLRQNKALRIYKMEQRPYLDRNPFFHYDKGADCTVPLASLTEGDYEIGVLQIRENTFSGGIIDRMAIKK